MTIVEFLLVVAAVLCVIAFVALIVVLVRVLDSLKLLRQEIDLLRAETGPLLSELRSTTDAARDTVDTARTDLERDLQRFDRVLGSAEAISGAVESTSFVARTALSAPVIKAAGLASGTRRTWRRLRSGPEQIAPGRRQRVEILLDHHDPTDGDDPEHRADRNSSSRHRSAPQYSSQHNARRPA